jgi:hypothetical protein
MKNLDKPDTQNIGNAGEYFVASILSAYGFTTTITLGRAEAYDILAISPNTKKAIKVQVKTAWSKTTSWRLGEKCEKNASNDFFYFFVSLNDRKANPDYWVVSSKLVAKFIAERHKIWLNTPGKRIKQHTDNSGRTFVIKKDDWFPPRFNIEDIIKGQNKINEILEFDK